MTRKPTLPEQDAPMPFPVAGLDISDPYDKQRVLTTRDAINVRSFESLEQRGRGGSRSGLTKYIFDTVSGEAGFPVQHLNFLVDPTPEALLDDDGVNPLGVGSPGGGGAPGPGPDADDFEADPSTSNRRRRTPPGGRSVRKRGSGVPPNRNGKRKPSLPVARDDDWSAVVGGEAFLIDVMTNDTYLGEPSISFASPRARSVNGSSVTMVGRGTGRRIRFLPPTSGEGPYTFTIPYRLTAKGNKGSDQAILTVTVTGNPIQFVQASTLGDFDFSAVARSVSFPSPTGTSNLLVVVVAVGGEVNPDYMVRNAAAQPYTQIGPYVTYENDPAGQYGKLSMWYRIATGGVSEDTVTVTPSVECALCIRLLEWSGTHTTAPFDDRSSNSQDYLGVDLTSWSTGLIPMSVPSGLMVAAFMTDTAAYALGDVTFSSGSLRASRPDSLVANPGVSLAVLFVVSSESQTLAVDPTATNAGTARGFAAIGASFKPIPPTP